MAHELHETDTMFSVKKRPWHGLGVVVQDAPTAEEAIKLAGLAWEVGFEPLASYVTCTEEGENYGKMIVDRPFDEVRAVVRMSDGMRLGHAGPKTKLLQYQTAFAFFDPFIENGQASFETAGSLFNGRKIFINAKINSDPGVIVQGDEVEKFLLLAYSHDGSIAITCALTPVRTVCNNTLTMALKGKKQIKIRRTESMEDNLKLVQETISLVNNEFEATFEQYRYLASRPIDIKGVQEVVKIVYGKQGSDDELFDQDPNKTTRAEVKIAELFDGAGIGSTLAGSEGTAWGAYNAITEYNQAYRGRSQENRFNSVWFGDSQEKNQKALKQLLKV